MMAAEEVEIFLALGWHVPKFAGARTEVTMTVIFVRNALFLDVPKQFQTALTKNRRICDVNTRFIRGVAKTQETRKDVFDIMEGIFGAVTWGGRFWSMKNKGF